MNKPAAPDRQTQAFLGAGKAAGGPPLEAMTIGEARRSIKELMLAVGPPCRSDVDRTDLTINGPGGLVPVAVYQPKQHRDGLRPVIFLIHGGGWALGDVESYDNTARFFCAESDAVVVSADYRLAPEHKFPAGLDDAYRVLEWLAENAFQWGGDKNRISIMGDSSGGNFAAVICHRARNRGGPEIWRQILLYPVLKAGEASMFASREDFGGGDYFISSDSIQWSEGLYLSAPEQANCVEVSPILTENLAGLPPALIVTAGLDPLRDEGKAYADKLDRAGVSVDYKCVENTIHGFMTFPAAIDAGEQALHWVANWITRNQ